MDLFSVSISTEYNGCTITQETQIKTELDYARQIASYAQDHFTEGEYFGKFFPDTTVTDNINNVKAVFGQLAKLTDASNPEYPATISISCVLPENTKGTKCDKSQYLAAMKSDEQTMYFCPKFFDDKILNNTK